MKNSIYFDEKKIRKQRLIFKFKIYSGLTIFFLLIIGACYLVIYSPIFQIKNIEIVGSYNFDEKNKLVQELKLFFINQSNFFLVLGPNNILIWKEDVDQFKKNNPQVAELVISKNYLNRKIKIEIKEREKYGVWCIARNNIEKSLYEPALSQYEPICRWFDRSGILFADAPFVEGALINKVSDFTGRNLIIGDKILEQRFLFNLLKIFEILEKMNLGTGFLKLENLRFQEIIFNHPVGFRIYFSLRIDPIFTLAVIQHLREIGLEEINYIDFRTKNRAYYKIR